MIKLLLSTAIIFLTLNTNAASISYMSCSFAENVTSEEAYIKMTLYTDLLFGTPSIVQAAYSYPKLSPNISLISSLKVVEGMNGTFTGQISNIDYLVDVVLNTENGTLEITDGELVNKLTGSCIPLEI